MDRIKIWLSPGEQGESGDQTCLKSRLHRSKQGRQRRPARATCLQAECDPTTTLPPRQRFIP